MLVLLATCEDNEIDPEFAQLWKAVDAKLTQLHDEMKEEMTQGFKQLGDKVTAVGRAVAELRKSVSGSHFFTEDAAIMRSCARNATLYVAARKADNKWEHGSGVSVRLMNSTSVSKKFNCSSLLTTRALPPIDDSELYCLSVASVSHVLCSQ